MAPTGGLPRQASVGGRACSANALIPNDGQRANVDISIAVTADRGGCPSMRSSSSWRHRRLAWLPRPALASFRQLSSSSLPATRIRSASRSVAPPGIGTSVKKIERESGTNGTLTHSGIMNTSATALRIIETQSGLANLVGLDALVHRNPRGMPARERSRVVR